MKFENLVVLDSVILYPEHRARLEALAHSITEYNTCSSEDEVSERCLGADGIISCWVDIPRRIIDENPQLRAIAFWTHDFEHRIDAPYALAKGIHIPAIPDYGTDSVAELVFMGLLKLSEDASGSHHSMNDAIVFEIGNQLRGFNANVKDTLGGRWVHEYVKNGDRLITSPDEIPGETLKGLTVGFLEPSLLNDELARVLSRGLQMNIVYALGDAPHSPYYASRPVERLLQEADVIVHRGTSLSAPSLAPLALPEPTASVDISNVIDARLPLKGRRLGIIGLGRIGTRVAQIATEGFGMEVQYFSRTRKPDLEEQLNLQWADLETVLTTSDAISLHLPHHGADDFITPEMIDMIPAGAHFINCSVGNIIADEDHLLTRCENGEINAFLDVYRTLPPKERLRACRDNVVATYRLGWRTKSTVALKTHKLLTKLEHTPDPV